jgi:hypothetical protein
MRRVHVQMRAASPTDGADPSRQPPLGLINFYQTDFVPAILRRSAEKAATLSALRSVHDAA